MDARNILLLAALAGTVLAGCTNDDEAGQAQLPDLSGTPIRIQAGIDERALTRAGEDGDEGTEGETPQTTELASGEFGLFLTTEDTDGDERYNATNMKFTGSDGTWTADPEERQLLWKNNTTEVSYYAYMPYDDELGIDAAGEYTFSVKPDQDRDNGYGESDFLHAKGTANATGNNGAIGITFSHKLTRLLVSLTREKTAEGVVFSSVTLKNCLMSVTFDLADGEIAMATAGGRNDIILHKVGSGEDGTAGEAGGSTAAGSTESYECILVPQAFDSTNPLTVEIAGTKEGADKLYRYTTTHEMTSGNSYTLALSVGNKLTEIGSVRVTGWIEGSWGSGENPETGTAGEIVPGVQPGTHTIVTLEEGQIAEKAEEWIAKAMGTEGIIKVVGPMNQDDMKAISANKATITELDLSEATGEIAITDQAFMEMVNSKNIVPLQTLKLGSNVTSIAYNAFAACTSLQEVDLSACSSLTSIEMAAFYGCNNISNLKLPMNGKLETIKTMAFMNCDNIKSITFPETLKQIGNYMFNETNIETLVFLSQKAPLVAKYDDVTDEGNLTDLFYASDRMSNVTIYLPNVQKEDADAKGWTAFFVDESNYSGVKYGENPSF